MTIREEIISALEKRYAVKTFDPSKKVSDKDLRAILESGRLSPSSFGIEPWKFVVVTNSELRKKMRAAGYGQMKITDASHVIAVAYRTDADALVTELVGRTALAHGKTIEELDGLRKMVGGSVAGKQGDALESWLKAQTYIPLGIMILTAALLGIDSCPMEGFDPGQIDAILKLNEKNLRSATMFAVGYRGDDAHAALPKVRRSYDDAVITIE
jgi:nitroreductase